MRIALIKRYLFLVVIVSAIFYPSFCPALKTVKFMDKQYVYLQEIAKEAGMKVIKDNEFCTLRNNINYLSVQYNKRRANANGVEINLLYPPSYNNGNPIISQKDYNFVLRPIFNSKAIKRQYVRTIILDPGHGGDDNGTSGSYSKEKNVVLSIARKVASILTASGYKVVMTRNSDKFISLESRAGVIDRYKGDIFVSIHCNSAKKSISGYETFVLAPQGSSSTYSTKAVYTYENGNTWDRNNERLGYEIQKALGKTNREDRALKHARFAVLRYATKPAALVEAGFLSNPKEEKLLNSSEYQDQIAKAIVSGIIEYANAASKGN
jgi:N-acetylmuramoyl-L-alanine amidase